jgi:hypothetical protein
MPLFRYHFLQQNTLKKRENYFFHLLCSIIIPQLDDLFTLFYFILAI